MDTINTQAIYDAVGQAHSCNLAPSTLIICEPAYPAVCIGYHQVASVDVDKDFCRRRKIPIVRRILGGGGVLLDRGQIFYQIIAKRGYGAIPYRVEDAFKAMLRPVVHALQEIGVAAKYRALNDIQVGGRKISGNGATAIDDTLILTGNVIVDFDYETMCATLRVPSEKFRDKVAKSLRERVTTLRKELGFSPARSEIERLLVTNFEREMSISLQEANLTSHEERLLAEVRSRYLTEEWLFEAEVDHRNLINRRELKISGSTRVVEKRRKTSGGVINALFEVEDDIITDLAFYGDFSFYPREKLKDFERSLIGLPLKRAELSERVLGFFSQEGVEAPGVSAEEFALAVLDENSDQ